MSKISCVIFLIRSDIVWATFKKAAIIYFKVCKESQKSIGHTCMIDDGFPFNFVPFV